MLEVIGSTGVYAIVGVVVLAVASLLGLVLFASKEETFEDVFAAQKKEQEALLTSLQGTGGKSGKPNKKWNKLKNKKATRKEHEEADSGVDDDEPSSDSVAVPPTKIVELAPVVKSSKKSKKVKPVEPVPKPKTEVEKPKKPKIKKEAPKKVVVEDIVVLSEESNVESAISYPDEEIIVPTEEISVSVAPECPVETSQKKPKSNKSKQVKKTQQEVSSSNKLLKDIEVSHLNSDEVQHAIDLLLAKQNEAGQWQKPNQKSDPLEQLKKQLSELDLQLMAERKLAQNAAVKSKELSAELQRERTQRLNVQSQAGGRLAQQAKEQETLRKRMEEQHLSEMQSTQIQIQRMQGLIDVTPHKELQQLKEENNHLKNASLRAQQLAEDKNSLMNELNQLQQSNKQLRQDLDKSIVQYKQTEQHQKTLQDKVGFYEKEIQSAQISKNETENVLLQRLQEVNEQLVEVEAHNRTLLMEQYKKELNTKTAEGTERECTDTEMSAKLLQREEEIVVFQERLDLQQQERLNEGKMLNEQLEEVKQSQNQAQQSCDNLKLKNNELREKNWKAIDALGKAEEENKEKIQSMERSLFKGLKRLHPEVQIPSFDENRDLNTLLLNYENSWVAYSEQRTEESKKHITAIEEENVRLNTEITEFKMNTAKYEDLLKSQAENEKLKNVLIETESMLSELQSGVDIEVGSWTQIVEEKDEELNGIKKRFAELENSLTEHGFVKETIREMENDLKDVKQQLEQEKLIHETKKEELQQLSEKGLSLETELADVNSKLKKTISGHDLLICEYKIMKDQNVQHSEELKKLSEAKSASLKLSSEEHEKELKKLWDQVKALENTSLTTGKGDKEKDKLITELHKKVDDLSHQLQEEKETKLNLSVKLNDLEKSYQEDQSEKERIQILESKLAAAELRVKELETTQSVQVESQIEEAMQQCTQNLVEIEKNLEHEKQTNIQLRIQLAAATTSADIGTSV